MTAQKASDLQDRLMDALSKLLDKPDCEECGRPATTAAELNVIRQLLKDNNVTDLACPKEPTMKLYEKAPFADPHAPVQLRPVPKEA
jgi:hypothetical protein